MASPASPASSGGSSRSSTDHHRIYAIGDVHGRLDLLDRLADLIEEDAARQPDEAAVLWIFLGDYVDRGPDSAGVIERVMALSGADGARRLALCGNHEFALIKFLGEAQFGPTWMAWGGGPTLRSYGVKQPKLSIDAEGWERAREDFERALPDAHRAFLLDLPFTHEVGRYFFVHAGVRAGTALDAQTPEDLLMIREDFLEGPPAFPRVIVHGHTPQRRASDEGWRIGVDTGAYATGVLSAACIEERGVRFIATPPP